MIGTDVLLLGVLGGITLLGYMVAINAHGPVRLSFSYLVATLMLTATVYAVVQYVNMGSEREQLEALRQLEQDKKIAEERIASQQQDIAANKKRMFSASRFGTIINQGTELATSIANADLRDLSIELDALIARAYSAQKSCSELSNQFESVKAEAVSFPQSSQLAQEAVAELTEAAKYYGLYYRSEDSAQEELRERLMRQKARSANEKFKKALALTGPDGAP